MRRLLIVALIVLAIAGIAVLYIAFRGVGISSDPETPTLARTTQTPGDPSPTLDPIPADWVSYTSEVYDFMLRYPPEFEQDTTSEGERFYRLGSTQVTGTELFDGISVVISSGETGTTDFRSFVETRFQELQDDTTQPKMSDIQPVSIAQKEGFSFEMDHLGKRTMIYLPREGERYVLIIDSTVEPTNRPQTYKDVVSMMLSTLIYE